MSLFTTPVEVTPFPWRSDHARHHVLIGSCFTEHVGTLMTELKFPVTVNPSGILYNPVSVASCLRRLVSGQPFTRDELFEHDGLWHSYSHHGRFSAPDAGEALENINRALTLGAVSLRNAGFLLITLGTARVYEHRATGETVANCHKVPAREFRPYRLTVAHAVASLREALEACWQANPSLKVILTVSPVRHNQDGPTENQLSKAVLLLAADALVSGYGSERCAYFPAYEIMMDELRDYRFYQPDMVHPSPLAVEVIWEKFSTSFFTPEALRLAREIARLRQAVDHRPIHPATQAYRLFLTRALENATRLAKNHPGLDFSAEIDYFSKQIGD